MQYRDSRQEVTGLVVNSKVNVPSEYRHIVRAMVNRMCTAGTFAFEYRRKDATGLATMISSVGDANQLQGMLAFIDQVEFYNKTIHANSFPVWPSSSGRERLYRSFLLFNRFYDAKAPIIICEGKTDNVYIVHAIRSLVALYPQLATQNAAGTISLNVHIFKYVAKLSGRILGMHGGVGGLKTFISQYHDSTKRKFKAVGAQQPVIILIDNDAGSKDIFAATTKINKKQVTGTEPFIHVASNLYVVPTPKASGGLDSKIEDCFDTATLATQVDGKTFDASKDADTSTHYGKVIFAHQVVKAKSDKINFSGFQPLLMNVVAVIDEHKKKHASLAVAEAGP